MKGVPNPSLQLNAGEVEFPLVSYSYSVSYEFLDEARHQKRVSKLPLQAARSNNVTLDGQIQN